MGGKKRRSSRIAGKAKAAGKGDDKDGDHDDGVVSISSRHSGLNDDVEEEDRDDVSISSRHSGDAGDGDDDVKDDKNDEDLSSEENDETYMIGDSDSENEDEEENGSDNDDNNDDNNNNRALENKGKRFICTECGREFMISITGCEKGQEKGP